MSMDVERIQFDNPCTSWMMVNMETRCSDPSMGALTPGNQGIHTYIRVTA
jgi:hypothetical protein